MDVEHVARPSKKAKISKAADERDDVLSHSTATLLNVLGTTVSGASENDTALASGFGSASTTFGIPPKPPEYRCFSQPSFTSSESSDSGSRPDSQTSMSSNGTEEPAPEEVPNAEDSLLLDVLQAPDVQLHPSKYKKRTVSTGDALPLSPHGYFIPSAKFDRVSHSLPGTLASCWQYSLYQSLGEQAQKVGVDYCTTKETMETIAQQFLDEDVIGFDVEWVNYAKSSDGIKKNVSLVQIASERRVALFHLARFPGEEVPENFVSPAFKKLMESPSINKVGVVIKGDSTRLRNFLGIECRGLLELSNLHKLVSYCSGGLEKVDRRWVKLSLLVQTHLGLPLWKGPVRTSDWSRDLRSDQIEYAASDVYAGLHVYYVLEAKRKAFDPTPPRPVCAELRPPAKRRKSKPEEAQPLDAASKLDSLDIAPSKSAEHMETSPLPPIPYAQELAKATTFIESFKSEAANPTISPRALRAYYLWHQQGLDVATIADILRTPPVLHRTVVGYLCDALSALPSQYQCPAEKIKGLQTGYGFQPYKKPHKDLFAKAIRDCARTNEGDIC